MTLKSYTAASCHGNPQTGGKKTTVDLKILVKLQQLKWQLYSSVSKLFIVPFLEINTGTDIRVKDNVHIYIF